MAAKKTKTERALVLRCCGSKGESHHGFRWPLTIGAEVSAPDWRPTEECGNGLHGWLHGAGDHSYSNYADTENAKWLVVSVESASIIMLGGKCKFPACRVEFVGNRPDAAAYIREHDAHAKQCAVIGAVVAVGDNESAAVGALGTATAGYSGTATAGYRGTATAGDSGTIVIEWYDRKASRYRRTIGYVGEDGILANVRYGCDDAGKLVRHE